jgi:phosphoribosyl 1,2-cyclic phosphate phosphodiesterase
MSLRFVILGCGSSSGVPRLGGGWGACDPTDPKNRRRRCSLLVERSGPGGTTRVLVDTSPDIREQLLDANVDRLDGVLFTHSHADHTHGIDDLRALALHQRSRIDVYTDEPTSRALRQRFGYCFETPPGSSYPPILREHRLEAGLPVQIDGAGGLVTALPVLQSHGDITSLGFRFEALAYSCDLNGLPAESVAALQGLDIWIVDALRYTTHPSHWSVAETLDWIARLKPARAVLTNMHVDLDYAALHAKLPPNVEPAYDGMSLSLDSSSAATAGTQTSEQVLG